MAGMHTPPFFLLTLPAEGTKRWMLPLQKTQIIASNLRQRQFTTSHNWDIFGHIHVSLCYHLKISPSQSWHSSSYCCNVVGWPEQHCCSQTSFFRRLCESLTLRLLGLFQNLSTNSHGNDESFHCYFQQYTFHTVLPKLDSRRHLFSGGWEG